MTVSLVVQVRPRRTHSQKTLALGEEMHIASVPTCAAAILLAPSVQLRPKTPEALHSVYLLCKRKRPC